MSVECRNCNREAATGPDLMCDFCRPESSLGPAPHSASPVLEPQEPVKPKRIRKQPDLAPVLPLFRDAFIAKLDTIIRAFGGVCRAAREMDIPQRTIFRWRADHELLVPALSYAKIIDFYYRLARETEGMPRHLSPFTPKRKTKVRGLNIVRRS